MECKKCQEALSAYYDKELDDKEKKQVKIHLEKCNDCMRIYKALKRISGTLKENQDVSMPYSLHNDTMRYIEANVRKKMIDIKWVRRMNGLAAVGLICVFLVQGNLIYQRGISVENSRMRSIETLSDQPIMVYAEESEGDQLWQVAVTNKENLYQYLINYNKGISVSKEEASNITIYYVLNVINIEALIEDLSVQSFVKRIEIVNADGKNIKIEVCE